MTAGLPHGMRPLGMKALNRARIEAGLLAPGVDFNSGISPYEAGIGWCVSINKADTIGVAALERRRNSPYRIGVGLVLRTNEIAPVGEHVFLVGGRFAAGVITSATFSPVLGKSIALAQLYPEYAASGTVLEVAFVDNMVRRAEAIVGPLAAYDPKKRRVRS
jgi:aminomethyltransferase